MIKILLLILFLILPSTAFSFEIYDVSCRNVAQIRIVRVDATRWNIESDKGCFHVLALELKPESAKEFVKLRNAAPTLPIRYRGEDFPQKDILITASGKPIQNDAPALTGFMDQGINISIILEEDAFKAALMICPDLVPDKVLIDGHWE